MSNSNYEMKPNTSYRKTYVLKQQTPMIHFQYADSGVAIRASEFKPKLDKFLVSKLGNDIQNKKDWLLKQADNDEKKTKAFNYRVKIIATGTPKKSDTINYAIETSQKNMRDPAVKQDINRRYSNQKINGMYFGNMVSREREGDREVIQKRYEDDIKRTYKETIFYSSDIYVEIQCFIKDLLDFIDDNFSEFLLVTNFGTRQSKGFGSFSLKDEKNDAIEILNKQGNQYNFAYCRIDKNLSPARRLDIAFYIYAVMKGGINMRGTYIKGYIQREYLNSIGSKDVGSDKAFAKAKVFTAEERPREKNELRYPRYEYVRAILGLPVAISFKDDKRRGNMKIEEKKKEIERFQSAIQITFTDNYIIFILRDSYREILGREFVFTAPNKKRDFIKAPQTFEPQIFLSGFVTYYNGKKSLLDKLCMDATKVKLEMGREEK